MIGRSISTGFSLARRSRRLIVLVWLLHLGLASLAAVPFGAWAAGALGSSVEAESLANGFDIATFGDLTEEYSSAVVLFGLTAFGVLAVGAISSAFASSGVIGVLLDEARGVEGPAATTGRHRPVLPRFFESGGRFFWRSLGLSVLTGIGFAVTGGIAYGAARAATRDMGESLSEPVVWFGAVLPLVVGAVFAIFWWLVLDVARISLVAGDRRGAIGRTWLAGLRFVSRRVFGVFGLWLAFALPVGLAMVIYLWVRGWSFQGTWAAIWVMILAQQLYRLWRTAMRVGLVGGQIDLAIAARLPGTFAEPAPVPAADDVWLASVPLASESAADLEAVGVASEASPAEPAAAGSAADATPPADPRA